MKFNLIDLFYQIVFNSNNFIFLKLINKKKFNLLFFKLLNITYYLIIKKNIIEFIEFILLRQVK